FSLRSPARNLYFMNVTFRLQKIASDLFGYIYRPYAEVIFYGQHGKPRRITMVVDTGADYSILPRREAALLGIDLSQDCTSHTTYGVGGPQTVYLYRDIEVQLGEKHLKIPVGFLDKNDVPPLLGRHQFMELFQTCFDQKKVSFESST
ncbi:MAG: retroviral-like aspartic protease family protein, partial [Nitrospira sp.]|nr:retroviral-like aspartic protease family protein [Nitrospira sp.]